jgi:hypothetical protein
VLEIIRRKEAEVRRRLIIETEALQAMCFDSERRGRELIAAAEAEGRAEGVRQREHALAEAEREAHTLTAQARAQAELLQRLGVERMEAAVRQALAIVIEVHR